ncbi:hypothetical protein [Deinococcus ficus]|uniref:Uncharacterized protein n=1 Tax=Deinococcus ficus TaxID=317577 RepID=A0A221T322_9DEIO|nr:hypothetical protein [Deinococcus ficus]ASN83271.1 hypothetical protein DFI_18915 [Deinococcus ficus]
MLHINELIKLVIAIVAALIGLVVVVSNVAALPAWLTLLALTCVTASGCLFLKQLLSPCSRV